MSSLSDNERKAAHAAWKREWRKNNPDKERAARKRANALYRERYPEKIIENNAKYYAANKDKDDARRKSRYWANREEELAKQAIYREANKERIAQVRKENPEWYLAGNRVRRARKLGNGHEPYSESQVLELYGDSCHICELPIDLEAPRKAGVDGWEHGLHIDHLLPLSKGGPDTLENVRPAHGVCNVKKNNREK
jgi:5-methylcytosine-specific restriction endonuclease McrA